MYKIILLIIVVLTPLILSLIRVTKSSRAKTVEDFFNASRKMDGRDLINTTVSYGYQIAAISLFATWGFLYGFWTIWVPVFWYIGFKLIKYLNDKGSLEIFFQDNKGSTIHGFLKDKYKLQVLGKVAAIATILGLSGTAFFEAEFTSKIISSSFDFTSTNSLFISLFLFFVLVVLAYILWGGLKTIIQTNSIQLKLGFILFNVFFSYVLLKIAYNGYLYTSFGLFTFSIILVGSLNMFYPRLSPIGNLNSKKMSLSLVSNLIIYIIGLGILIFNAKDIVAIDSFHIFLNDIAIANPISLGGLAMVSLLIANGLWQIVDISTWQRLSAIDGNLVTKREISKSLDFSGLYSAVTWAIAILFGIALKYVNLELPDAWTALEQFTFGALNNGTFTDQIFISVLFISMIFVMYSTLDSLISAISYTVYFDIVPSKQKTLSGARKWTILYTIIFLGIYLVIRYYIKTVDSILYTFYSFQLALFPAIILIFLKKQISAKIALLSIIGGILGTLIPLYFNNEIINPYTSAALFSIGISTIIIIFGLIRLNKE